MEVNDILKQKILMFSDENLPADILHGKFHRDRVLKHAELINTEIKANWDIIYISVLCHDIGHSYGKENHHIISADLTGSFLAGASFLALLGFIAFTLMFLLKFER